MYVWPLIILVELTNFFCEFAWGLLALGIYLMTKKIPHLKVMWDNY